MRDYSRGRERQDLGAPQGQGRNALAGAGHRGQHIWRLEVTSSPRRHPSAHVLKCVSFTKYSVCWGPVNAWLFLAGARWRTLLAGSAKTYTYAYSYKPRCHTHTSAFILQETWSFRRIETELLLFGPFATPTNVENSNNDPFLLLQHLDSILWGPQHVSVLGLLRVSICNMVVILCRWHVWHVCSAVHWVHHTRTQAINHFHFSGNGLNWFGASQSGAPPTEVQIKFFESHSAECALSSSQFYSCIQNYKSEFCLTGLYNLYNTWHSLFSSIKCFKSN